MYSIACMLCLNFKISKIIYSNCLKCLFHDSVQHPSLCYSSYIYSSHLLSEVTLQISLVWHKSFTLFFNHFFKLKHSWFTMLCYFQVYSKVIQLYIYMCIYVYMHVYIYILFQIVFHNRLLQDIEYSSLCYTVGLCCLSILYIVVCIC